MAYSQFKQTIKTRDELGKLANRMQKTVLSLLLVVDGISNINPVKGNEKYFLRKLKGPLFSPTRSKVQRLSRDYARMGQLFDQLHAVPSFKKFAPLHSDGAMGDHVPLYAKYKRWWDYWSDNNSNMDIFVKEIIAALSVPGGSIYKSTGQWNLKKASDGAKDLKENTQGLLVAVKWFKHQMYSL
ncbi:MAG TPA: hypothetical protein VJI32_07205 [Candidatus Nanoarchaeia archaeon]|nr:hypothetical protein [Candidatus Nanoarchaeia archaeon]